MRFFASALRTQVRMTHYIRFEELHKKDGGEGSGLVNRMQRRLAKERGVYKWIMMTGITITIVVVVILVCI